MRYILTNTSEMLLRFPENKHTINSLFGRFPLPPLEIQFGGYLRYGKSEKAGYTTAPAQASARMQARLR